MALEYYYQSYTLSRKEENTDPFLPPGTTTTVIGTFRGLLQDVRGDESNAHFKVDELVTHRLYTNVSVDIRYGDIITYNGRDYIVAYDGGKNNGISGMEHIASISEHKEVLVRSYGNQG